MTRKTLLAVLCAATGLVSFAASSASFAADPAPATGKSQFLADRHVEKYGLKCESCHTKDMKVKQSGDYDVCVDCHGDYEKMIKKTEGKYEVNPHAITIAEEVSGMPGLAAPFKDGGYGFDYRMAMNIPDYWIKIIKERRDEDWKPSSLFWEVTNRRADEHNISYCESHDQALVGDKTIIFRLIDADMYWHFRKGDENGTVHRGIALHKMIRLLTASTINGGYLNFMGNEFGHPEWIDFPREGNGWSYKYARRQWNLVDNHELCYHYLGDFDREMLTCLKQIKSMPKCPVVEIWHNDDDQILAYSRSDTVFVFNFSPTRSYTDYGFMVPEGEYDVILNTDAKAFGGNGLADDSVPHLTNFDPLLKRDGKGWLKLYIPARSAVVLKKKPSQDNPA